MSPKSSTPLDHFQHLTIDAQMSPTNADIRTRAVEIRDILSSFDRNVFPSEFLPRVFEQLDRPLQTRPPTTQWTIQEDLSATLLQWGCYNDQAYELLTELQSRSILVRCFYEKLSRRTESLLDLYDRLQDGPYPADVRTEIQRVAQGFRKIITAVREDRRHRDLARTEIAKRLLGALTNICRRHVDIPPVPTSSAAPRRGTRRAGTSTEGPMNLYDALIRAPAEDEERDLFMLDVLETFPGQVFASLHSEHANLVSLLDTNDAPPAYKYRIGRLPSGPRLGAAQASGTQQYSRTTDDRSPSDLAAEAAEAAGSGTSSIQRESVVQGPSTTQPAKGSEVDARPTTGSKRAAEEPSTTSRRRNKKATRS